MALSGGYAAYARYWRPSSQRGAVLYHHGIQSHCGWYEASARRLAEAGYAVLQWDRRGSGRNRQDRGHAESADQLVADALCVRDELARRSDLADHHVVGVSWGGRLAVAAYVTKPDGVRSLTLVTPGLFPRVGVSKEQAATIGMAMLYEPMKRFDIPLSTPELFTADAEWLRFIDTDELTLHQATAGFYLASRRMDKIIGQLPQVGPVPLHLLTAGDEGIIDNDTTTDFIRRLNWPTTRITRYDNARHSLEFESDAPTYFSDLVRFLDDLP